MSQSAVNQMVEVIREIVQQQTENIDRVVVCQILERNQDGTYNIYIEPDHDNVIHNIQSLVPGLVEKDYCYLYKVGNKIVTSFILKKISAASEQPELLTTDKATTMIRNSIIRGGTSESSGGGGGGGGEPTEYLKQATLTNNTLGITRSDGTSLSYSPLSVVSGGGVPSSVNINGWYFDEDTSNVTPPLTGSGDSVPSPIMTTTGSGDSVGEISEYLKSAVLVNNTLTITRNDNTTVDYTALDVISSGGTPTVNTDGWYFEEI